MQISHQTIGDVMIVKIDGMLDATTMPTADHYLRQLLAAQAVRLILDVSDLSYIASAGIRVLQMSIRESRRQSGDLRLVGLRPSVERTLQLVGLLPAIKVYADLPTALASFV